MYGDLADPALRVGCIHLGIQHHFHPPAQRRRFIVFKVLIKLYQPGMTEACDQAQYRAHGKLTLMDGSRVDHGPKYVECALVHVCHDAREVGRFELVRLHHLKQCVGCWMRVAAGSVVFERGLGRGPASPQAIGQSGRVCVTGHAGGHALRALKNLRGTGKTVTRQTRRHQARSRCMGSVQLFRICSRAQKLPQPGRLCSG